MTEPFSASDARADERLSRVASLGEPIRRALYQFVVSQRGLVSRDEAAAGVGVARHVAKFHLDRLEQDGLLEAEYRRPPGRSGPGAGRPAKLYRRASKELSVTLPERRYELAARLMARAIARAEQTGMALTEARHTTATESGRAAGEADRDSIAADEPELEALRRLLEEYGYEPAVESGQVILHNCPFHAAAQESTEVVCEMNRDFLSGMLDGIGMRGVEARLDPAPDRCCVVFRRRGSLRAQ